LVGPDVLHRMLPVGALAALKLVAEAGLVPYLVGVAHKLELGAAGLQRRALGWVARRVPPGAVSRRGPRRLAVARRAGDSGDRAGTGLRRRAPRSPPSSGS
jgi:hypothetical protein